MHLGAPRTRQQAAPAVLQETTVLLLLLKTMSVEVSCRGFAGLPDQPVLPAPTAPVLHALAAPALSALAPFVLLSVLSVSAFKL